MLKSGKRCIAICLSGIEENDNIPFLNAFDSLAESFGFRLLFFDSFSTLYFHQKHDIGESHIFWLINYDKIDGLILMTESIKDDAVRKQIVQGAKEHNVPVVSMDHPLEGCYNVRFNYAGAMEEIVEHLITVHHYRRINFIAGMENNSFSDDRLNAYKRVLTKYKIPIEQERIGYGQFWYQPTEEVLEKFLNSDLPFPEAIVCANDSMALTAYNYLTEAGYHVPEDIALTGFDGIAQAIDHYPSITTAKHNFYKAAMTAFEVLESYFQGEEMSTEYWVKSSFVQGSSCGCEEKHLFHYSTLLYDLRTQMADYKRFEDDQISMTADLTDNDTFDGVFENLKKYADNFCADTFWLCIVDDFLEQSQELDEMLSETKNSSVIYPDHMDIMLSMEDGEWEGISDFSTKDLLPNLDEILEREKNIMFLPLHVLDRTVGYLALVYEPKKMNMIYVYQFCMSISNALDTTRVHANQRMIIDNLENKYVHDPMTGLYNRRGFYQRVEADCKRCQEQEKLMLVVSVDLNGLKPINDTYGHADGDLAIQAVGKALTAVADASITCARFGGDEFVAAGPIASQEIAKDFCDSVLSHIAVLNKEYDKPYQITASIGMVAAVPTEEITLKEMIREADERMYEDKVRHHAQRK